MSKDSFSELIKGHTPVLVDFTASWCGPCKMLVPILKELKNELGERIKIIKIDVDKNRKLAKSYQIQGVPTMILYKDGQQLWRQSGVLPTQQLKDIIEAKS